MRYILVMVAILAAACATTKGYENILNSWVGLTELDLVRKWGSPQQTYEAAGHKFLAYSNRRNVFLPGAPASYQTTVVGNTAYTNAVGGSPAMNIGLSCITTFELEGEKIVRWSWKGNDCKAKE